MSWSAETASRMRSKLPACLCISSAFLEMATSSLVAPRHGFDVSSQKCARRSDDYRLQPTSLIHAKTAPLSRARA